MVRNPSFQWGGNTFAKNMIVAASKPKVGVEYRLAKAPRHRATFHGSKKFECVTVHDRWATEVGEHIKLGLNASKFEVESEWPRQLKAMGWEQYTKIWPVGPVPLCGDRNVSEMKTDKGSNVVEDGDGFQCRATSIEGYENECLPMYSFHVRYGIQLEPPQVAVSRFFENGHSKTSLVRR